MPRFAVGSLVTAWNPTSKSANDLADQGTTDRGSRPIRAGERGRRVAALNDAHVAARAAGDEIPVDLKDAREATEGHLAEAVASLETIRLGLLRLTTGTGTVERLTTDLAAAADVGDAIDHLMTGMTDVELLLRPT